MRFAPTVPANASVKTAMSSPDPIGTVRFHDLPAGQRIEVSFVPEPGAPERVEQYSAQLLADLKAYRQAITEAVQPWSNHWAAAHGWGEKIALLEHARERGLKRGAHAWGRDQVGFLKEVGHYMAGIGHGALEEGEKVESWYQDLPLLDKVFPVPAAERALAQKAAQGIEAASEDLQKLWEERRKLLQFFQALHDQSVNAVEIAIETLAGFGGELGRLMQALWDHGAAWVQGLIEVCRQTEAIQQVFASVGALFAAIPPNLWAEGISTGIGYIVPEVLLAAILALLAALTEGAGASALVTQLLAFVRKIKGTLEGLGDLGPILLRILDGIRGLGHDIAELTKAAWVNIDERIDAKLDQMNVIRRTASKTAGRRAKAESFLRKQGIPDKKISSYLQAIDYSKPAKVRSLKQGEIVEQWNYPGHQGDFYTVPGTNPETLGITMSR
jgi:hypothetical protein